MKKCEQVLEDLKQKYNLLIQTVHEMNELIHEMRKENQSLKKIVEEHKNERE